MRTPSGVFLLAFGVSIGSGAADLRAQSLSSGLGATKLDGLRNFTECQNQAIGRREHLIADRLDLKLATSPALTPPERDIWLAEIRALREVKAGQPFKAPDAKAPQRYLLGLTNDEQVAINSMNSRFVQEVHLFCEQKYGGMTRYSPGSDQSGQARYEQQLRSQMGTPIDIATVAVGPLPSPYPKTAAELAADRRAAQAATRQAIQQQMSACTDPLKGLRLSLMADRMQRNLDGATGLSAKDRAAFEADIRATRASAAKGLDQPEPADPAQPLRALQRLTPQDHVDIATEYSTQYSARLRACMGR